MKTFSEIIMGLLVVVAVLLSAVVTTTAHGQLLPGTIPDFNEQTRIFQSIHDGIRFRVPEGWVVADIDNTLRENRAAVGILGFSHLAVACPQSEAQPAIGGLYHCDSAETEVFIRKDFALNDKEEFRIYSGRNVSEITIDDYLAYDMQGYRGSNVEIVSSVDKPVNIVFTDTNRTVTTPGKFAELLVTGDDNILTPDSRLFSLLTIINEGGTTIHGYQVSYEAPVALTPSGIVPNPVQEIFDSFEILAVSPS